MAARPAHPETGHGGDRRSAEARSSSHSENLKAFVEDTAAKTGKGRSTTAREGTLGTRFGGIKPDADLSAEAWTAAIHNARRNGVSPLSKDTSMVARVPLSNDVITYLVSQA
jgi:hypothetical protein